jgi:hypothetical protein
MNTDGRAMRARDRGDDRQTKTHSVVVPAPFPIEALERLE